MDHSSDVQNVKSRAHVQAYVDEPWSRDFYAFLRHLEALSPDKPRVGYSKHFSDDLVLFHQSLHLDFAPSTIQSLTPLPERANGGPIVKMESYFLGLTGPNGPLPLAMTEYIWARSNGVPHPDRIAPAKRDISLNRRDTSLKDFLNIFNHRFTSFFYRAWASSRKTLDYDRPDESRFASFIGSLLGVGGEHTANRMAYKDEATFYFSGHLTNQSRHPSGLAAMVSDYLKCPVKLEENVGHWLDIPAESCVALGTDAQAASLGEGLPIGSRMWDRQLRFDLKIGPLKYDEYIKFLPDANQGVNKRTGLISVLRDLVSLYTHREFFCVANIILKREDAPVPSLGEEGMLGCNMWLNNDAPVIDPSDLSISIN